MSTIKNSEKFHQGLGYDYKFGVFYRMKLTSDKLVPAHLLFPNAEGLLQYFCAVTKKNKKVRPLKAAYEIFNERELLATDYVYPKDLDDNNWKAENIGTIERTMFNRLRDSLYNIRNGVNVSTNPDNPYTYTVKWKENGKIRTKTVHDVTKVYQLKRIIMLRASKIVSKYTVST